MMTNDSMNDRPFDDARLRLRNAQLEAMCVSMARLVRVGDCINLVLGLVAMGALAGWLLW